MHASGISAVIVLCKPVEAIVASLYLPSLNKQTAHVEDLQRVADSDQLVIIVRLARTVHLHKVAMYRNGQIITRNDQISYGFLDVVHRVASLDQLVIRVKLARQILVNKMHKVTCLNWLKSF